MKRTTIDYGIDLGTTNSAIARFDSGDVKIIKSLDDNKDITSSAVSFNKKGSSFVGSAAYEMFRRESTNGVRKNQSANAFIEFKRTMGTNKSYYSSFTDKNFSSEDFSSEVLKYLKGYVNDEKIEAAIITIPAAYTVNQIDAVRRAAQMAGLKYIQTLQEPIAAAMAFGVEGNGKNGFWLVFDFGGGTFDAALIKVEDGIVQPIDSSGDNHLGGKDLDFAIVDNLIIPHIEKKYQISEILGSLSHKESFRQSLKFYAETLKNQLSFQEEYELYVAEGDFCEDDNGEEIEIEITVNRAELKKIISPVFQRAIDLTKELLARNNIPANKLESLLLVGGPTLSHIIRDMLEEQICKPNTSVDPMTVVARGAAIYASTIILPNTIIENNRDLSKVQLEINYETTSVELTEFVAVKVLGEAPSGLMIQISRSDGSWISNKENIDSKGEVIDVFLEEAKTNSFNILMFDESGNRIECEPTSFNIIQGSKLGGMPLPHNFGIEILDFASNEAKFTSLKGLEKNTTLPAIGRLKKDLKTQKDIRPGMREDFLKIPLYQGDDNAEGTRAINNEHVYDVVISGADLPKLLPAGSLVELIVTIDQSQKVSVEAFFPYLEFTYELEVPTDRVQNIDDGWLNDAFKSANLEAQQLGDPKLVEKLVSAQNALENNPNDVDTKTKARNELRTVLRDIDHAKSSTNWEALEQELKEGFERLASANGELGNSETTRIVNSLRNELEQVIHKQDAKAAQQLLEDISNQYFQLTRYFQFIHMIENAHTNFDSISWKDRYAARSIVDQGVRLVEQEAREEELFQVVKHLVELMPMEKQQSELHDNLLIG